MLAVPPRYPCDPITGEVLFPHTYDGQGRETRIERPGAVGSYDRSVITIAYDALGRRASETQDGRAVAWQYDIAGRVTRRTWPDNVYVTYDYTPANELTAIRDSGGTALVSYNYDWVGRLAFLGRANGKTTAYEFDPVSRLSRLDHDDLYYTDFSYNPASQIRTRLLSNTAWAWDGDANGSRAYTSNALNQYTAVGGVTHSYDLNGNLTDDGPDGYAYDPENRMKWSGQPGGTVQLRYDGRGRLRRRWGGGNSDRDYLHAGDAMIAEYNFSDGTIVRRYVHGAGVDDPAIWYEGAATTTANRRFLHADERGSITTVTDNGGVVLARNTYDEWGVPAADNMGRFQYTGQQWLPEIGLHYYKARFYNPTLGRFMQTDPVGYEASMNLYAYASNDPLNFLDSDGLQPESVMDRRNQALLQSMEDCEGRGAACARAIGEGVAVAGAAASLFVPGPEDMLLSVWAVRTFQGWRALLRNDRSLRDGSSSTRAKRPRFSGQAKSGSTWAADGRSRGTIV